MAGVVPGSASETHGASKGRNCWVRNHAHVGTCVGRVVCVDVPVCKHTCVHTDRVRLAKCSVSIK